MFGGAQYFFIRINGGGREFWNHWFMAFDCMTKDGKIIFLKSLWETGVLCVSHSEPSKSKLKDKPSRSRFEPGRYTSLFRRTASEMSYHGVSFHLFRGKSMVWRQVHSKYHEKFLTRVSGVGIRTLRLLSFYGHLQKKKSRWASRSSG